MKFFSLVAVAGLASADQFLVTPVSNPFELMDLMQAQDDLYQLQMLSENLMMQGVELENLGLGPLIQLQNLGAQCMNYTDLIKDGEGLRTKMYYDTMGIPTICYGYNLQNYNARQVVASAGGNFDSMMAGQPAS